MYLIMVVKKQKARIDSNKSCGREREEGERERERGREGGREGWIDGCRGKEGASEHTVIFLVSE